MANTVIQLKYSSVTNKPPTLNIAEPAYSSVSGTLWLGDGTNVIAIGGKDYTDKIDAAASIATANVLVKRDTTGNAAFNYVLANVVGSLYGNAQTATKLETARYFNLSGDIDAVSYAFDGTANVDATLELTNTGVSSGNYGGSTNIPVFNVDADGRITYAANVSVGTTLGLAGDSGTGTLSLLTDTLTLKGGDGITSNFVDANNTLIVDVDNTVIRTTGGQTITGDITVTGNLSVTGNLTSLDINTFKIEDPLIQLAANNEISDAVDIGFIGHYSDDSGVTKRHTGLVRHASDGKYYLFKNYTDDSLDTSTPNNIIDVANTSFQRAILDADIVGGNVSSLFSDIAVADGGTGRSSFTSGAILIGNSTGGLLELANTGTAGTYGENSRTLIVTTDAYGRVTSISNNEIKIDASQVTSGVLGVARGGSGASSFTVKGVIVSDSASSTGALSSLTSSTEGHVLQINSSGAPVFAHLNGGTF